MAMTETDIPRPSYRTALKYLAASPHLKASNAMIERDTDLAANTASRATRWLANNGLAEFTGHHNRSMVYVLTPAGADLGKRLAKQRATLPPILNNERYETDQTMMSSTERTRVKLEPGVERPPMRRPIVQRPHVYDVVIAEIQQTTNVETIQALVRVLSVLDESYSRSLDMHQGVPVNGED